jgi:hypothetical protein
MVDVFTRYVCILGGSGCETYRMELPYDEEPEFSNPHEDDMPSSPNIGVTSGACSAIEIIFMRNAVDAGLDSETSTGSRTPRRGTGQVFVVL